MARDFALEAKLWIARNPKGWDLIEGIAFQEAIAGRRVSFKRIVENVRSRVDSDGKPYKIDNSWASTFAREWAARFPEYADKVEIRHSCKLDPPAVTPCAGR